MKNATNEPSSFQALVDVSNSLEDVVDALEFIGEITKHKNKEKQYNALKYLDQFLFRVYYKAVHYPYKEVKRSKEIFYQMLVEEDNFLII